MQNGSHDTQKMSDLRFVIIIVVKPEDHQSWTSNWHKSIKPKSCCLGWKRSLPEHQRIYFHLYQSAAARGPDISEQPKLL